MSKVAPTLVACPRCGSEQRARLFESLNADRLPGEAEAIARGSFEQLTCSECGGSFRPEHRMLYAHFSERTWIVMHPPSDRARFATLERGVELLMERQLGAAPPLVSEGVRGVRPRLVFGQRMLGEALRARREGLDAALLECAKLLAVRRDLATFGEHPPFELCFEERGASRELRCGIYGLAGGERLAECSLAEDALAEAEASRGELTALYPELFSRPYVSACRYLWGASLDRGL